MADKFCELCTCDGSPEGDFTEKNVHCPMLGGNICQCCCQAEINGGMGDTKAFQEFCKKSERTQQEAHAGCVACPNGGSDLDKIPKVIYVKPGFEEESKAFEERWQARLDWLNEKEKEKETDGTPGENDAH